MDHKREHRTPPTRSFIYADDLCVTAQQPSFVEVETTTERTHTIIQIQQSACKPRQTPSYGIPPEEEAKRMLKVKWNRTDLENTPHPRYLGVTLDQTLGYKQHIHNTKMKMATHNNLLRKLSSSKWGTNSSTIRTTALH